MQEQTPAVTTIEEQALKASEPKQVGNDLFQQVVVRPYAQAVAFMRSLGARPLTSSQAKRKVKNRAKRKMRK